MSETFMSEITPTNAVYTLTGCYISYRVLHKNIARTCLSDEKQVYLFIYLFIYLFAEYNILVCVDTKIDGCPRLQPSLSSYIVMKNRCIYLFTEYNILVCVDTKIGGCPRLQPSLSSYIVSPRMLIFNHQLTRSTECRRRRPYNNDVG